MARNLDIKPEPGLLAPGTSLGPPPSASARTARHLTSQSSRARGQPSTLGSQTGPYQPSERRKMRSAAPSIDTRRPPDHSVSGGETNTAGDGTEDCLLMEMRPCVRDQINTAADESMSRNTSFVLNGLPFQNLGEKLKPINDTLGKLQSLGIQHVTNLPELVLVGDQSSGKSSVMSALAGLNLPRSAGMCTKCPIHIRLSSAREWSCVVSLHEDYAYVPGDDENISEKDVTAGNPYPPWKKQPRVIKNLKTIKEDSHDTKDIEIVLRWAQVAILNHGYDHTQFIPALYGEPGYGDSDDRALARLVEYEASTRARFSPNTVALEISGPGLTDMSFYDLPGVVAAAANNDHAYLEKVLENLVREYISHPGAVILWAVPMNADAETSQTFKLIRQGNAQERCVTVMTKADLLPTGGHEQWIKMLKGESHKTNLGYFITSRRELEFANGASRESWEESFFNRRANNGSHFGQLIPEWPREFGEFDDVCGVSKLKVYLSQKLGEEFAKSLPQVKKKIETKLREVEQQLSKLPDLPANAEFEIRKALIEFATAVKDCLSGKELAALWAPAAEGFRRSIIAMKPKVIVKPEGRYSVDSNGVINLADSDSMMSGNSSPQKHRLSVEDHLGAQTKRVKHEDGWAATPGRNSYLGAASVRGQARTLAEIRDLLQSKRSAGKPSIIPPDVYEQLCMEAIRPWEGPLKPLVDRTRRLLNEEIQKILKTAFSQLKKRMIFKESEKYLREFLDDHLAALSHRLARVHKLESRQLYTLDHESFSRHQEDERQTLARARHHYRWIAYSGDTERNQLKQWADLSQEERSQEAARTQKEAAKLGKDPFEAELGVAAYVRGYYLTAASRFIDTTSLHITSGLFPEMAEEISLYLDGKLGLLESPVDPKVFENLMDEDKHTISRRDHLKAELTKFQEAMKSIQELEIPQHRNGRSDSDTTYVVDDVDIRTLDDDDDFEVDGDGRSGRA